MPTTKTNPTSKATGAGTMAVKTLKQLEGGLQTIPGGIATGNTVENKTLGLLTLVKGKEETIGSSIVIKEVPGSEIEVAPGKTSAALTFGAGESYYIKNFGSGMSTTVPEVVA